MATKDFEFLYQTEDICDGCNRIVNFRDPDQRLNFRNSSTDGPLFLCNKCANEFDEVGYVTLIEDGKEKTRNQKGEKMKCPKCRIGNLKCVFSPQFVSREQEYRMRLNKNVAPKEYRCDNEDCGYYCDDYDLEYIK